MGISLIPAFGTLYQRLTLPESTRYLKSTQQNQGDEESNLELKEKKPGQVTTASVQSSGSSSSAEELAQGKTGVEEQAAHPAGHEGHFTGAFSLAVMCGRVGSTDDDGVGLGG